MRTLSRPVRMIRNVPYWWMYAVGVVLLLASLWLWWTRVYLSPSQVFWGMIENSLSTQGVTVTTAQNSDGSTIKQHIQFELGATNQAHSLTTLKQGDTEVKTEIIGTPDTDYTRYRSIKTEQRNAAGEQLDTSSIVNQWTKSDNAQQSTTQTAGNQLFAQAVLGIGLSVGSVPVPIGLVPAAERAKILNGIQRENVYETSFKSATKTRKDGRLYYTYKVKIQTILYVRLMKNFAQQVGLHELDEVDPNSYQTTEPMQVTLVVDAASRHLVSVERAGTDYRQEYSGYGLPLRVSVPDKAISSQELQRRLEAL